ncbi:hypothetical protein WN943_006528 [Citrus x changshan-huyou]
MSNAQSSSSKIGQLTTSTPTNLCRHLPPDHPLSSRFSCPSFPLSCLTPRSPSPETMAFFGINHLETLVSSLLCKASSKGHPLIFLLIRHSKPCMESI